MTADPTPPATPPELPEPDGVEQFRRRLADPDATTRPQPAVWSTTEYACHVRDVCELFAERLRSMLDQYDPLFANWDQDRTAQEKQYWRRQPAQVGAELAAAGAGMVTLVRGVGAADEARPGRRSNGSVFTVETFLQYFAHDLVHHAHDIRA